MLIRNNELSLQRNSLKIDKIQKAREFTLTELDGNIHKNINCLTENNVHEYFSTNEEVKIKYENNEITYNKNLNCFLVQYNIDNKFYKEELYEYRVINGEIFYGCIDYSFIKGEIK